MENNVWTELCSVAEKQSKYLLARGEIDPGFQVSEEDLSSPELLARIVASFLEITGHEGNPCWAEAVFATLQKRIRKRG